MWNEIVKLARGCNYSEALKLAAKSKNANYIFDLNDFFLQSDNHEYSAKTLIQIANHSKKYFDNAWVGVPRLREKVLMLELVSEDLPMLLKVKQAYLKCLQEEVVSNPIYASEIAQLEKQILEQVGLVAQLEAAKAKQTAQLTVVGVPVVEKPVVAEKVVEPQVEKPAEEKTEKQAEKIQMFKKPREKRVRWHDQEVKKEEEPTHRYNLRSRK